MKTIVLIAGFTVIICIASVASLRLGTMREGDRIQSTCESDDVKTVINGTTYLCLTRDQLLQRIKTAKEKQA